MTGRTIQLAPEAFFHARPATLIAAAARRYESVVMVCVGISMADAKDAIALMRLPHPHGAPCDLFADGADEAEALEAVAAALEQVYPIK